MRLRPYPPYPLADKYSVAELQAQLAAAYDNPALRNPEHTAGRSIHIYSLRGRVRIADLQDAILIRQKRDRAAEREARP